MVHADRMGALLGVRRIVDDPGLDRSVTLDCRHHQLAHLGEHPLVRPLSLADEMQELLMLHRTWAGAVTAAIGSTLLRPSAVNSPAQ
jgi:hypothetical protein